MVEKYDAIIHSDYWPRIAATLNSTENRAEAIAAMSPEDYQRVLNTYYREVNDLRNQHYQYQEGYLPEEIWERSSRAQIRRMIVLAIALDRLEVVMSDSEFGQEIRRIAAEEGIALPDSGMGMD